MWLPIALVAAVCTVALAAPSASAGTNVAARQDPPASFKWSSSAALVYPKDDGRNISGIKDPSVIFHDNVYHVFASTASEAGGYNLVYMNFTDFAKANSSTFFYLDQSGIDKGYRAAPQVFWFSPHSLWYLIFQNGNAAYSTNQDINNPAGWSAPTNFYNGTPSIVTDNIGSGYWVDMWTICDATDCHLFSSDDNGHLFRSQTTLADFPTGMSEPVIAESASNKYDLYEASNVYNIGGGNFLLIVEAIGSAGRRYFRSWTSTSLNGTWSALAATEANPFAGAVNVVFNGTAWTEDISHGEVIRTVVDQTMTITPCNLRYLYQGMDPGASGAYNGLPWRLALLTQTNSVC